MECCRTVERHLYLPDAGGKLHRESDDGADAVEQSRRDGRGKPVLRDCGHAGGLRESGYDLGFAAGEDDENR